MAATILNSPHAARMSVYVVRAFVRMRQELLAQTAMEKRLTQIEMTLVGHDAALRDPYLKIRPLLSPATDAPLRRIGFRPTGE